jgi:serine/threonine-protein kinase
MSAGPERGSAQPPSATRAGRARELFDRALDLSAAERAAFLDEACADDGGLRAEVDAFFAALASAHTADLLPGLRSRRPLAPARQAAGGGDPPGPSGLVGRLLANYRIEQELARGGMGVVYRAQHILLPRAAAVKVLHDHLGGDSGLAQRLLNEARAVNAIRHPHIVELLDAGLLDGGAPYLVMELLAGESLGARIARSGALSMREAATIGLQIAAALAVAHDHAIVHRDMKPENVFLCRPEQGVSGLGVHVKVLDFGIAKLRADIAGVVATQEGGLMGTPQYMAPEQWRDPRSGDRGIDVYALGLILFEMLAGKPAFEGAVWSELYQQHTSRPPPPLRERVPGAPVALEAVIGKALAKRPDERYASMHEIASALKAAVPEAIAPSGLLEERVSIPLPEVTARQTGEDPVARERQGRRGKVILVLVAAAASLAIGIGLLSWLRRSPPNAAPPPAPTIAPRSAPAVTPSPPVQPSAAPASTASPASGTRPVANQPSPATNTPARRHPGRRSSAPTTPKSEDSEGVPTFLKNNPYK